MRETRVDPGRTKPAAEGTEPKPSQVETKVGLSDARPSHEGAETRERRDEALKATMPSSDDLAFVVEDELDYERERDEIEAMLFGTPVATHRIARFAIIDRLGQGAMGTVYTAYDEELDRKVAVKVLRKRAQADSASASARLLREAQAMARLNHPNIVGVHEVGRHEGRVFVAMEFVRGLSLDRWLREGDTTPRPWREVVEVFRQAGEGLAAAHTAGVIHRDFKPHNVILGDDGVVRVLDFGLARQVSHTELDELPPVEPDHALASQSAAAKLTATGAVMGTPAYMAPEQCLGRVADARSDQFGFCAALYEGLYGQLPFAGDNFYELVANLSQGAVREPPKAATVPAWVHRIVMRGLAIEPEQRHPSMRALVDALGRDPAQTRRRWFGAAAIALGAGLASVGLTMALQGPAETPAAAPCSEVAAGLDEVYDAARLDRAGQSVLATGLTYARETWSRLGPRLDRYADEWIEHSESVCLAHHDGRLSPALFDRATSCLAERRASLDAMLGVLEQADASVVEQASDAVAALPALAACADEQWLSAAVPRPSDPELAAAVDDEREQLAAAMVLHHAGRSDAASERLDALDERAAELDDAALLAEAALARGTLSLDNFAADEADAALSEAITHALAIDHTEVASEAVARRLFVRGVLQQRLDEAVVDRDYGAALVERLPPSTPLRWLFYNNAGALEQTRNQLDRADALYARALDQLDADAVSFEAAVTRSNRAQLALARQDIEAALAGQRAALDDAIAFYGPSHPMVANYLYILASLQRDAGKLDAASETIARALAIRETEDAPPETMRMPLRLSAELALARGEHAQARATAERALADAATPDFVVIRLRQILGDARIGLGEIEAGLAAHRRALADAEQLYADNPGEIARTHEVLALALLEAGDVAEALAHGRRAVERREADPSTLPPALASALLVRGRAELVAGQLDAAAASFTRARDNATNEALLLADAWTGLADLAQTRGQAESAREARARALELREPGGGD